MSNLFTVRDRKGSQECNGGKLDGLNNKAGTAVSNSCVDIKAGTTVSDNCINVARNDDRRCNTRGRLNLVYDIGVQDERMGLPHDPLQPQTRIEKIQE